MAAIIAQISLQAANRRRNQIKRIPIDKSNVKLPPFDPHFDPEKHNSYTIRRNKYILQVTSVREWHEKVIGRIIDVGGGIRPGEDDPTTMSKFIEVILISTALSLVPLLMIGVELLSWM